MTKQSALLIRPARDDDGQAVQTLARELGVYAPEGMNGVWVAVWQSALVGFIAWQVVDDVADLLAIAITPNHQQRGIAKALYHASQPKALCTLEVRESNLVAQALYHRLGYQLIARRKAYYPSHNSAREDALIYQRDQRNDTLSTQSVDK